MATSISDFLNRYQQLHSVLACLIVDTETMARVHSLVCRMLFVHGSCHMYVTNTSYEIEKAVCNFHRMICLLTSSYYISYVRTVIQYCEASHFLCAFHVSISLRASLLIFFLY